MPTCNSHTAQALAVYSQHYISDSWSFLRVACTADDDDGYWNKYCQEAQHLMLQCTDALLGKPYA